jgi:hypothetical protein
MISTAVNKTLLSGFSIGTRNINGIDISHLLFVDDTLIFCEADPDQLRHLWCLFLCFEVVLGLKIDLAKLEFVLVGNVDNVDVLAGILGCEIASLLLKYLGLLLGASYKAKPIWDGVIEKIKRQLASWKMVYLSKGGKLILIKSTLSNLPMYFMYFFLFLLGVATRIQKLQWDFLWGGLGEELKYHT